MKGSCHACAKKIKPVETYICRDMFNEARVYLGIRGRRPKGRPTHFSLKITFADRVEIQQFPAADIPWHFAMPEFGSLPGLMIGQSFGGSWANTHFHTYGMPGNAEFFKSLKEKLGAKSVEYTKVFQITPFVRQLAKIAHAFAVATKGLDNFKPLLPPMILGDDLSNLADLVGGVSGLEPHIEGRLHELYVEEGDCAGKPLIVVRIRLFTHVNVGGIGTPTYYAVVGVPVAN